MEQIFLQELGNDVLSLEAFVRKLDSKNEIVKNILELVSKIKSKCRENNESKSIANLDLAFEIKKTSARFENLSVSFMISSKPMLFTNKFKLDDLVSNICQNALEAGADQLRVEIRDSSIVFYDNGSCTREVINKLRDGELFSTKIGGKGFGAKNIRSFCNDHHIVISYYLSPSIDYKFKKESLAIKLVLK